MKVLVLHDGNCRSELKQIEAWLKASGCVVMFFDLSMKDHETPLVELIKQCDLILILLTANIPTDELNIGVLAAKSKGMKIVGVQLADVRIAKEFDKYASALVDYNQQAVMTNVLGDGADWTDTQGVKRPTPKSRRHNC